MGGDASVERQAADQGKGDAAPARAGRPALIAKNGSVRRDANLKAGDGQDPAFSWAQARRALSGLPGGGFNIAFEAADRHVLAGDGDRVAFRFLHPDGAETRMSFAGLARQSDRFCNVLRRLGVQRGERVFLLCNRRAELYVALLGALKNGCVVSPLFPAFGPEPILTRLTLGDARVLVTTDLLYQRKVAASRAKAAGLEHVLLVAEEGGATDIPRTHDLAALMREEQDTCSIVATAEDDPALLHFTSGTTGMPKGALHVHGAAVTHYATGLHALDLRRDDVFWCTADPGCG